MAIAQFYEIYRYFNDSLKLEINNKVLMTNMIKIMKLMIPFTPHIAYECLTNLKCKELNQWPKVNEVTVKNSEIKMFVQITGRTNVSTTESPFVAPIRMRNLIVTDKEHILVYADWKSQEAVIQAYLSDDKEMITAIKSGDIYLHTAKKVGAVPAAAIRKDYEKERELYKQSFLAIGYGQTAFGLKDKLGISLPKATFIHAQIVKTYNVFQEWTKRITAKAMQRGYFLTKYGWKYWLSDREIQNPRRLLNWPIQSHGSEILRRAMIDLDEEGFEISMIVHLSLIHI